MSLYIPKMSDTPGVTIPGLAGNFGALEGSQTEIGTNANGSYIKFENGLGIARGLISIAGVTTSANSSFSLTTPLALPASGLSTSIVANYAIYTWQSVIDLPRIVNIQHTGTGTSMTVFTLNQNFTYPAGIYLSFIIIGRWK